MVEWCPNVTVFSISVPCLIRYLSTWTLSVAASQLISMYVKPPEVVMLLTAEGGSVSGIIEKLNAKAIKAIPDRA